MKPITFAITRQCGHKTPCEQPPEAEPETRWRSSSQITVTPPAKWTRAVLAQFIVDLCAQASITDLTLVEFRGGGGDADTVTVSGCGHSLGMGLTFIPDAVLGSWLCPIVRRATSSGAPSIDRNQKTHRGGYWRRSCRQVSKRHTRLAIDQLAVGGG